MSANTKLITTYSKALFQSLNSKTEKNSSYSISKITSTQDKNLVITTKIIGEELLIIRSLLLSSNKIKNIFKNPTYSESQKLNIILTLFPGLSLTMNSFLKVLTERNHLYLLPEISDEYQIRLSKIDKIVTLNLIIASPISDSFGSNLLKNLRTLTKANEIILNVTFNPKLLGGLIVEFNSMSIDASILKEFSLFFTEL